MLDEVNGSGKSFFQDASVVRVKGTYSFYLNQLSNRIHILSFRCTQTAGSLDATVDLAHVANGGLAVAYSDQHFGRASNLLLPGRGVDMGDGWETRRSREGDHCDWVTVKLGTKGVIEKAVVDTAHFKGNFPKMVKLEATQSEEVCPLL